MKYRLRIVQLLLGCACGVLLCLHFSDYIWTQSVDLAHHYALVARLSQFGDLPRAVDPSLGEMQIYPRLSHRIASAVGGLFGSPLAGMQIVGLSSMVVLWAAIAWMLWSQPSEQARRATTIVLIGLIVGGSFLHLDFWGEEIVRNYFYAQFVAQAAALVVLAIALTCSQARLSRFVVYGVLIVGIAIIEFLHLLPAVELLGFLGLLVISDLCVPMRRWNIRSLLVSAIFPFVALIVVVASPVFRAMASISENNGVLRLPYVPDRAALLGLVLVTVVSSIVGMRYWVGLADEQRRREQLVVKYFAIFGLSVSVLCLLQMAALALGRGSEYACRKYAFGLWTVLLINVALALGRHLVLTRSGRSSVSVLRTAFDYCAMALVISVAMLTIFPGKKYLSLSGLLSMEHRLEAVKAAEPAVAPGTSTYAIQLPGEPPLVDYLFSLGIFRSARSANTIDILQNRDLSLPGQIGLIVTSREKSRYDISACQRSSADPALALIDGQCYAKSIPDRRFCRGEMHLTDAQLMQGFSWPEENGTWTDGNVAAFHCEMPQHAAAYPEQIRISGFAFVPSTHVQHVSVSVNGGPSHDFLFDSSRSDQSMVLPVPKGAAVIQIRFSLPDAMSPYKAGMSGDRRELGLYIESIQLLKEDGAPI